MKKIAVLILLAASFNFAIGQDKHKNDPTYSSNNYKHPNKAAYASKHNFEKSNELEVVPTTLTADYKHPQNEKATVKAVSLRARKEIRKDNSYKHPSGL